MEHLIFKTSNADAKEICFAVTETRLKQNWQQLDNLLAFVPDKTPWLAFDHDKVALSTLENYPTSAGFNETELWKANFRGCREGYGLLSAADISKRAVSFFQAWFFYGLLESFVGKKIEVSYLMRYDSDGCPYLYSRNLHFCLQSKIFEIRNLEPVDKLKISEDVQLELRILQKWIKRFAVWGHSSFRPKLDAEYPGFMDQLENIMPAILRLAETIECTRVYGLPYCRTLGTLVWQYPDQISERRRMKLRTLGWCPFQIRMLEDTVNQSSIDWIVATSITQNSEGHEECTSDDCKRSNIDTSTYKQAHVRNDCHCDKLLPNFKDIMEVLREDRIPLVRLDVVNGNPQLIVGASSKGVAGVYIAFSHVWADGLGGTTDKGLNLCQVERIDKLCKSFMSTLPTTTSATAWFWLDSLCIPARALDEDLYIKALVGIRDVYINASAVLVIDKSIGECSVSTSTEELYAYIYLSAWMQRMWTYEEAVLAKSLVFVLKDGFHTYRVSTLPAMRRTVSVVWQSLGAQLYRLRVEQGKLNIGHIYRAFRYRLTNVRKEEFISVSGMMGLDTDILVRLEGKERTKAFWLALHWIPFNVPFLDCPKLLDPGFRWAPESMMSPASTQMDAEFEGQKSECTEQGLIGNYLMVDLVKVLGAQSGSIFYVWITENHGGVTRPDRTDHLALLRVYCNQFWPSPPNNLNFDSICLPDEQKRIMGTGEWAVGVALLKEYGCQDHAHETISGETEFVRFKYVGKLLVERIQDSELSSSSSTIMFGGSARTDIDTEGVWKVRNICIT